MTAPLDSQLIAALTKTLKDEHLSINGLAQRLGFSGAHLSMILSGKRRPGLRFLRAVIDAFPEFGQIVAASISDTNAHPRDDAHT